MRFSSTLGRGTVPVGASLVATLVVLSFVGVAVFAGVSPVTADSHSVEIGFEDPGEEIAGSESIDLIASNVDTSEGIGAYEINITYNSNLVALDISGTDRFEVSTSTHGEEDEVTTTIVGYTGETEPSGDEEVTLADIEAQGLVEGETVDIAVEDVETFVEPQDATAVEYHIGDGISVDVVGGVAVYADADTGVVETNGLQAAITDWVGGDIDTGLLQDVISAWVSGNPV